MQALLPFAAVIVGALVTYAAQFVASRTALANGRDQIEYPRWDGWRTVAADTWAEVASLARRLDRPFCEVARLSDIEIASLREATTKVEHDLQRLSILALSRNVAEWASESARIYGGLIEVLPSHSGCSDIDQAEAYREAVHLLHATFSWNDGTRTTIVDRLRDSVMGVASPPSLGRPRRLVSGPRRRFLRGL